MMTTRQTDDMIRELAVLTTRDNAGRHFTEWAGYIDGLEDLDLITVHRPVHEVTGIPYGQEHWTVQITADGEAVVANNPELSPE